MSSTCRRSICLMFIMIFYCSMEAYSQPVPLRRPEMVQPAFKAILDSLDIVGSILVFDSGKNEYWSNDFNRARDGFIPASTFKIPNSLIAIETGYLEGESHVFKWDGQKRALPNWEQDLTLRQAFQLSCVPCYQQVAREIGPESMRRYLDSFNYGNIVFDSTQIDSFWLRGASNRCCSFSSSLNGKLI